MKILLDTNVLIAVFDETNSLHTKAKTLLQQHWEDTMIVPIIVMAEFLVAEGNTSKAIEMCTELNMRFLPTTLQELHILRTIPYAIRRRIKATDSLLLAHCLHEKAQLLTFDAPLEKCYKKIIKAC